MRLGDTPSEIRNKLRTVFGRRTYSKVTVYRLYSEYKSGRLKVGEKERTGQPLSARIPATIQQCDALVRRNRRVGIVELSKTLAISYGSVFRILHKDLKLKKRASKLVPHALTPAQKRAGVQFCVNFLDRFPSSRALDHVVTTDEAWFYIYDPCPKIQNMQWLRKGEDRQQVPRRPMGAKKVMLILFFDRNGLVHWEHFVDQTITKEVFKPLVQRVWQSMEVRRMRLLLRGAFDPVIHMDNAPAHRSRLVRDTLQGINWIKLKYPAYSPDLSPADFFLFPYLKRIQFGSVDVLILCIDKELGNIPLRMWRKCFDQWRTRCQRCILFKGNYFEGMRNPPQ